MAQDRELEELSVDECLELLQRHEYGRIAFVRDERPELLPLNYRYHEGAIVFRTTYGTLLDTAHNQSVVFEVDGTDESNRTGWSVIVHGKAEEVWLADELERVRSLPLEPWAGGERDHYLRISPSAISGRRVT
jgi:nitroimidazol reductase NimA-like FMN-containing flavoprotein (pyridoxamine 5'-phosphate oxidase superfamily)